MIPRNLQSKTVCLYATLGEAKALYLYTDQGFEQRAEELIKSETDPDSLLGYERIWFSLTRRVELDSAGRIRLPETLTRRAQLKGEVVLLGNNDHMEIRDRATWCDYIEQVLAEQPQMLMNPRRAIKRPPPDGGR